MQVNVMYIGASHDQVSDYRYAIIRIRSVALTLYCY